MDKESLAILSLVFGIIACVATYYIIIATIFFTDDTYSTITFILIQFRFVLQLISMVLSMTSIVLGIISIAMKLKRGVSIAGVVLGVVSLISLLGHYLIFD